MNALTALGAFLISLELPIVYTLGAGECVKEVLGATTITVAEAYCFPPGGT
jgi:hypothetical protein